MIPVLTELQQIPNSFYPQLTLTLQTNHLIQSAGLYATDTRRKVNSMFMYHGSISLTSVHV